MGLTKQDKRLLQEIAEGLPLTPRPYAAIAARIGLAEDDVIQRIEELTATGVVSRFGVIVRHRELGYRANAMVVWDLPEGRIDDTAAALVRLPFVTLCYQRPRRLPQWPYNLFCMIHGRSRERVEELIADACSAAGIEDRPRAVLFSRRRFKQRGARFDAPAAKLEAAE